MTDIERFDESTAVTDIEYARELDSQIRALAHHAHVVIEALYALVEEASAQNIHEALGFPSWTAYIADALDGQWQLERDKRGEVVKFLAEQGMSRRAIAKAIGVSKNTVTADLAGVPMLGQVIGLDGKSYTRPEVSQSGTPDEESDEEFLARLHAEREASRNAEGRVTFTIPATIEEAAEVAERIVGEQRRLERIKWEMELVQIHQQYDGWERDAKAVGATIRHYGRLARQAIDDGMTVEEYAEKTGISVAMVRDHLGEVGYADKDDEGLS